MIFNSFSKQLVFFFEFGSFCVIFSIRSKTTKQKVCVSDKLIPCSFTHTEKPGRVQKKKVSAERDNTYNRNGSLNPNRQNCLRIKVKLSSSHKQTSCDTSTEKIRYDSLLNNPFQNVPKYQLLIEINYLTELMIF